MEEHIILGGVVTTKDFDKVREMASSLREEGYEVEIFSSLSEVLQAIGNGTTINGFILPTSNVGEKIKEPTFRFLAQDNPELSLDISQTFAQLYQRISKELALGPIQKGIETRQNKADKFALETFEIVKQIQKEENVTSYRKTIDALNRRKIPTPLHEDGVWGLSTLQSLYKRIDTLEQNSERGR